MIRNTHHCYLESFEWLEPRASPRPLPIYPKKRSSRTLPQKEYTERSLHLRFSLLPDEQGSSLAVLVQTNFSSMPKMEKPASPGNPRDLSRDQNRLSSKDGVRKKAMCRSRLGRRRKGQREQSAAQHFARACGSSSLYQAVKFVLFVPRNSCAF